jgi:hypothetical protein
VITEPYGFTANVLRNLRRPNGANLDRFAKVGWWSSLGVKSTVYASDWVVPWIGNTVAHLPFMDGSSPDSQYWSTGLAGLNFATAENLTSYDFPNQAMPYSQYVFRNERNNRYNLLFALESLSITNATVGGMENLYYKKWEFQLRSDFVGTSDLVPIGGAFAKRAKSFWDGQGAMDAWSETGTVSNDDGIPDWVPDGDKEDYLRALADGLVITNAIGSDGRQTTVVVTNADYALLADFNRDGIKDWWQKMYGLVDAAQTDADMDGLADVAE